MNEVEYRATWLSSRGADPSWVIVTEAEVASAKADLAKLVAERAQLSASRAAVARLTADRERLTAEVARAETKTAAEYEAHRMTRCERDGLRAEVERLKAVNARLTAQIEDALKLCEVCSAQRLVLLGIADDYKAEIAAMKGTK